MDAVSYRRCIFTNAYVINGAFLHRENNINGVIDSTFSVENNSFGALKVHELKPNGASLQVTEDNKREYVMLYVNYRFMRGIEQQFLALSKGEFGARMRRYGMSFELFFICYRIRRVNTKPTFAAIRRARARAGYRGNKQDRRE